MGLSKPALCSRTDIAVFRAATGHWFVLQSSGQFTTHRTWQWGTVGDVPVASDYDGDGSIDLAIYRPSTGGWYILTSGSNFTAGDGYVWGADVPVPADYDGDGRTDIAVYRRPTGHRFILESSARFTRFSTYESPAASDAVPVLKQP